jgi:hypothetical protein
MGKLSIHNDFSLVQEQRDSWITQIQILKAILKSFQGKLYIEFSVPRMGKRIDVLLVIDGILFVLEFKIGESQYNSNAIDQVFDYALDLKNFHKESHPLFICPILICTKAKKVKNTILLTPHNDKLFYPLKCNQKNTFAL